MSGQQAPDWDIPRVRAGLLAAVVLLAAGGSLTALRPAPAPATPAPVPERVTIDSPIPATTAWGPSAPTTVSGCPDGCAVASRSGPDGAVRTTMLISATRPRVGTTRHPHVVR